MQYILTGKVDPKEMIVSGLANFGCSEYSRLKSLNVTPKSLTAISAKAQGTGAYSFSKSGASGFADGFDVASSSNYRKQFLKEFPDLSSGWQVHHTLPQKYDDVMKAAGINIHDVEYLKGVDPKIHPKITTEWAKWDKSLGHVPTAEEVADFAKTIDDKYSIFWFNK